MSWIRNYRFRANHPTYGERFVTPIIEDLIINHKRAKEGNFFRDGVGNDMLFIGADYTYFKQIEDSTERCEVTTLDIEVNTGGAWQTLRTGEVSMNEGQWDVKRCQVSFPFSVNDLATCLLNEWEEEYDVLNNVVERNTVQGLVGTIETFTTSLDSVTGVDPPDYPNNENGIDLSEGWSIKRTLFPSLVPVGGGLYDGQYQSTWVREKVTGLATPPGGQGWVDLGGGTWVRAVTTVLNEDDTTIVEDVGGEIIADFQYDIVNDQDYGNGLLLGDVFDYLLGQIADCTYTVKSNFFRLDPDGTLPSGAPNLAAQEGFDQIMIFQKSDIISPNAPQSATKLNLSIQSLIEALKNHFNVDWRVEAGNVLRIEHVTYFDGNNGLDFTLADYFKYIQDKNAYTYDNVKVPRIERWKWADDQSGFFEGNDITYSPGCSSDANAIQEYATNEVTNDISFLKGSEDADPTGWVIAAVYELSGVYYFNSEDGYINGHLALTNLHPNYWTYRRPQLTGNMNEVDVTFDSTIPVKRQEELSVKVPRSVIYTLDPTELIKTEIGWGEVEEEITWSAATCMLTINLLH